MTALFIDVSHHDWNRRGGAIDWPAVARAGMGRVMCARASYGDPRGFNPASPRFAEYMTGAKAAGFGCRGGYHNLIRGDQASINRQVDLLRSTMDRHGTEWAMADVEAYQELIDRGLTPRWEDVQRFADRWYTVDGRVMAWYIAGWVWSSHLGSPDLTGLRGPLINANYKGGDGTAQQIYAAAGTAGWAEYVTAPKGGPVRRAGRSPDIWQFTSSANVSGASDSTDCNAYRGDVAALVAMLTGTTTPPPQPQEEEDDMALPPFGPLPYLTWVDPDPGAAEGSPESKGGGVVAVWPAERVYRKVAITDLYEDLYRAANQPWKIAPGGENRTTWAGLHSLADPANDETDLVSALAAAVVAEILPKLPAGTLSREDVESAAEAAVRRAFSGGLAPTT